MRNKKQKAVETEELTPQEIEETVLRRKKRRRRAALNLLVRILALAVVVYVLFFVIVGATVMRSADMYPRIDSGDIVLFYRLDKDVKAQDIIVFEKNTDGLAGRSGRSAYSSVAASAGDNGTQQFISRVIAVAGDTVEITESGALIVNGSSMVESGIFYSTYPYYGYTQFPLTLGEGECFVLGDSRQGAADSRFFGPVRQDEIKGTVITIMRRNGL